jgi:uncharacterized membrane protein YeaQ/YmgE (transglycosylase-associated protein family)
VLILILGLFIEGLIVGALARLALPGPDPMGIGMTVLIGLGGSFIGGLIGYWLSGGRRVGGFILSVLAATLLVYLVRRSRRPA